MKSHLKFLFLWLIWISATSCKYYTQVYSTHSEKLTKSNNSWVFENDTLKIVYDFYDSYGKMNFLIYNKLSSPIYIDWKNSSFIYNGNKFNYWVDQTKSSSQGIIAPISSSVPFAITKSKQKIEKLERITFIPPNSGFSSSELNMEFNLQRVGVLKLNTSNAHKISMPNLWRKNKFMIGYEYFFNENESKINFRNYLAISFNENQNNFTFIDNGFYVYNIKEINSKCFDATKLNDKTKFYIDFIKK